MEVIEMSECFENVQELSKYLNVSKVTALKGLKNGTIPGRKVIRRWIVSRSAIEQWLNKTTEGGK